MSKSYVSVIGGFVVTWRANDNHVLDSPAEKIFDNALTIADLTHSVHTRIPSSQMLCDFRVGDVYVEIWGRKDPDYRERKRRKEELYKQQKLKLVTLEEKDCYKAKKVAQAIEAIKRKMGTEQKRIASKKKRGLPESRTLQYYSIAEVIAVSEGRTERLDAQVEKIGKEVLGLQAKIRRLHDKTSSLEEKRHAIISEYLV